MTELKPELRQCSRCHSTIMLKFFETNRMGELFKTCNNCRDRKKHKQEDSQSTDTDSTHYLEQLYNIGFTEEDIKQISCNHQNTLTTSKQKPNDWQIYKLTVMGYIMATKVHKISH